MKTHSNNLLRIFTLDSSNLSELNNKYMFICLVLDELAFLKFYEHVGVIPSKTLIQRIYKKMSYNLMCTPIAMLEIWLVDMQFMKLISVSVTEQEGDIIINGLTEKGEFAYQNQTYHQIYANMIAAKKGRELAVIAIVLSVISIMGTIAGFIIN